MRAWSVVIAVVALALGALACSSGPKVVFQQGSYLAEQVTGVGVAWGPGARERAEKHATEEALSKALPRAMEFTYLRADQYTLFRTTLKNKIPVTVTSTETLPDGGVKVQVKAARGTESMRAMRHMLTANITLTCKGETYRERWEQCETRIYSTAMEVYAKRNFRTVPEKMRGNFTFFEIEREDNDRNRMTVNMIVFVGMARGDIEPREKGMVYMNAWRMATRAGKGQESVALYSKAQEASPNAAYAEEFALFELSENRLNNAAWAIRQAMKLRPYELRYTRMLYDVYRRMGDTQQMAKVRQELEELEAWTEDMGSDIGSSITFSTEIRWTNPDGQVDEEGTIRFQDASNQ